MSSYMTTVVHIYDLYIYIYILYNTTIWKTRVLYYTSILKQVHIRLVKQIDVPIFLSGKINNHPSRGPLTSHCISCGWGMQ